MKVLLISLLLGVNYNVETDKSQYLLTEPVQMTFTISTLEDVTLVSEYQPTQNFWVEGYWQAVDDVQPGGIEVELLASESLTFQHAWDQRDNDGRFVLPGQYNVVGGSLLWQILPSNSIPPDELEYRTDYTTITIVPEPATLLLLGIGVVMLRRLKNETYT